MATFYIQLQDKLQKITGDLTSDNIIKALGYTPSNFSGDFNDLIDNPFDQDNSGKLKITDEYSNVIAIVDNKGIHSVDFITGEHALSNKANKDEIPSLDGYATETWIENKNYAHQSDLENINFKTLKENPISDDESGELYITDENANIILKITESGLQTIDVIAGEHILSNKANKDEIPSLTGYAKESWVTSEITKVATEGKVDLTGYATEEFVTTEISKIEIPKPDLSNYATKEEIYKIALNAIENNFLRDDESGEFSIVDEDGNVGLKLNNDALYVKDVVAGEHVLSNKADKEYVEQLVLDNTASTDDIDTLFENKIN